MQSPGHLSGDEGSNLFLFSFSANQDRWHKWSILIKKTAETLGEGEDASMARFPHTNTLLMQSLHCITAKQIRPSVLLRQ